METAYLGLAIYILLDGVILAWFTAAPFLIWSDDPLLLGLSMSAYDWGYLLSNCHQMPQRSTYLFGAQYPFCARDLGIYLGCLAGALSALGFRRMPGIISHPLAFTAFLAPMILDGVSQTIMGLRESSNELRLLTGFLFGFGLVYFFAYRVMSASFGMSAFRLWSRAALAASLLIFSILALSFIIGPSYVTFGQAVEKSGLDPDLVVHVPKRAMQTLGWDPYISDYEDPLLFALKGYGNRGHGVWAVYEGPLEQGGKRVFQASEKGRIILVPDIISNT